MRTMLLAVVLSLSVTGPTTAGHPTTFTAKLQGFDATGAAVDTNAQGHAMVEVIDGGTALAFKIKVAGIDNLLMAHIHVAPIPVEVSDPAGPIAYWFVGGPPPGTTVAERVNGTLARGYLITDGELVMWDAAAPRAGTVKGLIEAIEEGRASVVVHTDDLNPDTPTGVAGDSRAGELRGTLQ